MSYARFAPLKLSLSRALLIAAMPIACAAEVKPEFEDTGDTDMPADTAGTSAGGTLGTAGSSVLPSSGTTSVGGTKVVANPFGGTSSSGSSSGGSSSSGASSGGASSGGASGGSAAGGKAGASTGGSAGSSAGGTGTGGAGAGCACPTKKVWADNTTLAFGPGDCLDVAGALYLYTGVKAQTWANKDCNPTMQAAWCSDVGADYKFMLCK
jgi:hypothetical protein